MKLFLCANSQMNERIKQQERKVEIQNPILRHNPKIPRKKIFSCNGKINLPKKKKHRLHHIYSPKRSHRKRSRRHVFKAICPTISELQRNLSLNLKLSMKICNKHFGCLINIIFGRIANGSVK